MALRTRFSTDQGALWVYNRDLEFQENQVKKILFLSLLLTQLVACSAEVGSEKWCKDLKQKPKGEWSANEATDYAKHCLFK